MEAVRPKPFNPYIAKTVSQFIKVDGVNTKEVEKLKKTVKPKPVLKKNPKPKLKKSVKNKVELPEVLPGNGQHKAVGIIQGVLSTDGFKLTKKGKKLQKYILKIEKYNVEVKAKLTLGARKLAETKPDALLDKPHNFIVYPKFNKDGFHIEVVAFDDTHKSPISSVCSDCEFLFMGVWNRGRLLVQQSVNRVKKGDRAKIFKYKFERIMLHTLCSSKKPDEMVFCDVRAKLEYDDEHFKLCVLKVFECF